MFILGLITLFCYVWTAFSIIASIVRKFKTSNKF